MKMYLLLLVVLSLMKGIYAPPTKTVETQDKEDVDFLVEYNNYLKEVVNLLENDPKFREELEKADPEDIRTGKIADKLDLVSHHVRSQLDESKRQEIERLKKLYRRSEKLGIRGHHSPNHLDTANPKFETGDLKKLILQTASDMEKADQERKKEFKEYEMKKEYERRQLLSNLTNDERETAIKKHEEEIKKHKDHPKVNHPGSEKQLQEVWVNKDGLERDEFDPKTFFYLHDLDGNGYWDPNEVSALFMNELRKVYDENAPEDDIRERYEDMERMREHVFSESDHNKDGLISFDEFIKQTQNPEFKEDEGWEGLDQQEIFNEEELKQWGSEHGYQYFGDPSMLQYAPVYQPVGGDMYQAGIPPHPSQLQQQPYPQNPHIQQPYQNIPQQQYNPQQFQNIPSQQQQYQNIPQQQYQNLPPQQHQNLPQQQQYQNLPPQQQYQNLPPQQQYQNLPPQQHQNLPPQQYQNLPPQQHQNLPPQQHQNLPPQQQFHNPNSNSNIQPSQQLNLDKGAQEAPSSPQKLQNLSSDSENQKEEVVKTLKEPNENNADNPVETNKL